MVSAIWRRAAVPIKGFGAGKSLGELRSRGAPICVKGPTGPRYTLRNIVAAPTSQTMCIALMVTVPPLLFVRSTVRVVRPPGLSRLPAIIFEQALEVLVGMGVLVGVSV